VLCDFGSTTSRAQAYSGNELLIEEEKIRKHTTPAYRAPEMWDLHCRECIDGKADVWALGCMLYWLTFARLAFAGDAKLAVMNGKYDMPAKGGSAAVRQLIQDLLVVDPKERPDIGGVLARLAPILAAEGLAAPPPPVPRPAAKAAANSVTDGWHADFDSPEAQAAGNPAPPAPPVGETVAYDTYQAEIPPPPQATIKCTTQWDIPVQASSHANGNRHMQPALAVAPSPSSLPRSMVGSDAGSGASTPAAGQRLGSGDSLQQQLAEALAAKAVLESRCAQLEAVLRSQAATIQSLHQRSPDAAAGDLLRTHSGGSSHSMATRHTGQWMASGQAQIATPVTSQHLHSHSLSSQGGSDAQVVPDLTSLS